MTATLTVSAHQYLVRLVELGVLEGAAGKTEVAPTLQPVLQAMHHILAGGNVEVKVTQKGDSATVRGLNTLVKKAHRETDRVTRTRGAQPPSVLKV